MVVVASLKGGVGKTVSAVSLASVAAGRDGAALVLDADPQASARRWAEMAHDDGDPLLCDVRAWPASATVIARYRWTVVDTPPGDLRAVQAAVNVADVVLIPCQPSVIDVDRVRVTVAVAAAAHKPAAILLTRTIPNTRALAATRAALDAADLPVLTVDIPQRQTIAADYGARPGPVAFHYYGRVIDELETALT